MLSESTNGLAGRLVPMNLSNSGRNSNMDVTVILEKDLSKKPARSACRVAAARLHPPFLRKLQKATASGFSAANLEPAPRPCPLILIRRFLGFLFLLAPVLFFLFGLPGKLLLALLIIVIRFPGHPMLLSDGYSVSFREENSRQISRLDIVRKKRAPRKTAGLFAA